MLGVLLERATGQPLEAFLRSRLFEPLGMVDTSFSVPADKQSRFTTAYMPDEDGELQLLDPPTGGWWNEPPAMANAAGLLVSTLDDYWSFVRMLLAGGVYAREQVLSPESVAAMTRNHLTDEQQASATLFLGEHGGWGYGMAAPGPIRASRRRRGALDGPGAPAPRGTPTPCAALPASCSRSGR